MYNTPKFSTLKEVELGNMYFSCEFFGVLVALTKEHFWILDLVKQEMISIHDESHLYSVLKTKNKRHRITGGYDWCPGDVVTWRGVSLPGKTSGRYHGLWTVIVIWGGA
jgi:hypothetical protein